jgi:flagellar hook-associated protein 3 FlgL
MRVGDATFYLRFLTGLSRYRVRSDNLLEGLADGKKVRAASDDPAGVHETLSLRAKLARLSGYDKSASAARMDLATIEGALGEVVNLLTEVRSEAMAGASAIYSGSNETRAEVVERLREQLISISNTVNGRRYLFGGTETLAPPFAADGSYSGNDDEVVAPVDSGETVGATLSGSRVFLDSGDLFALLEDVALALREDRHQDVGATVSALGDAIDHIGQIHADIGYRLQRIDQLVEKHGDEELALRARIGEIEDIDIAEVITGLQASENASAALSASAARVLGRSLFDYLG